VQSQTAIELQIAYRPRQGEGGIRISGCLAAPISA
jgi:hypothetical protein